MVRQRFDLFGMMQVKYLLGRYESSRHKRAGIALFLESYLDAFLARARNKKNGTYPDRQRQILINLLRLHYRWRCY